MALKRGRDCRFISRETVKVDSSKTLPQIRRDLEENVADAVNNGSSTESLHNNTAHWSGFALITKTDTPVRKIKKV